MLQLLLPFIFGGTFLSSHAVLASAPQGTEPGGDPYLPKVGAWPTRNCKTCSQHNEHYTLTTRSINEGGNMNIITTTTRPLESFVYDEDMIQHVDRGGTHNAQPAAELPGREGRRIGRDVNEMDNGDEHNLMQQPVEQREGNNAWLAYLAALRGALESMDRGAKTQAAGNLLRYVNWHCNDEASGYFLGHMAGMTADITALLVVALGDFDDEAGHSPPIVDGLWAEAERFLQMHQGSRRARGGRIAPGLPCIMIITKWAPSVTPDSNLGSDTERLQDQSKRRCLQVVVTASAEGAGLGGHVFRLPIGQGETTLNLQFSMGTNRSAVPTPTRDGEPAGALLPEPGPGGLGEFGISMNDYKEMRAAYLRGDRTLRQIENEHGKEVARLLCKWWGIAVQGQLGGNEPSPTPCPSNQEAEPKEESDETVHMSIGPALLSFGSVFLKSGEAMDGDPLIYQIARDQLGRLRREGWTRQQQASVLYVMVQNRHCPEYMDRFPYLLADLRLEIGVGRQPSAKLPAFPCSSFGVD